MTYRSYVGAQICKGFILLLFLGLLALTIWGLTSVNRGFGDDAFAAIDAPFDYVDEVKAEVDAAGKPLQTIVQEKVPEAQQFVRVNMNGNSERSSIAFRDSLERSKLQVNMLYDNSTIPNPTLTANGLEALVEGAQRQQQYIDALNGQVAGLKQDVSNVADFKPSNLPTASEYDNLEIDLDALLDNPSDTTNKEELREELDAIEGSTSIGEISSLVGSLTQISRLDTDALQSSSAEAASPPSDADGSLQALKRALMMLHGIATELSVNGLSESQQTRQGLLPFLDARLDAIGQDVVELTAEVKQSKSILGSPNTDLAAMHSSGVDRVGDQLPQIFPIGDDYMLDDLRDVSGRLSGGVGGILAYVSAVRDMLVDFPRVRQALDEHDAGRIDDGTLVSRLGVFKDRITAARSGRQNTDFAGFQASATDAEWYAQNAEQSLNRVKNNLVGRQQAYRDFQQQNPTLNTIITNIRAVASTAFPQQDFIPIEGLATSLEALVSQASSVEREAASLENELQDINEEVDRVNDIKPLKTARDESRTDVDYYDDIRYRVNMALYGLAALFGLMLLVVCFANCPAGICIMNVVVLLYVILLFVLATIFGAILTVERDGCVNAEAVVKHEADDDFQPLLRYYFDAEDNTVKNILKEADIVDLDSIIKNAEGFNGQLLSSLEPFEPVGDLKDTLAEIDTEGQRMQDNVNGVIAKFEREPVMEMYDKSKCFACKDTFDEFAKLWYMFTFAGWLLMVMTWFANGLLGVLDKVPRANACCPCACMLRMPVEPRGHDEADSEESEDEKGFVAVKVGPLPSGVKGSAPSQVAPSEVDVEMAKFMPEEEAKPTAPPLPPIALHPPSLPREPSRTSGDE